jgi:Bacteroides conjugative transposon TraN protein
MKQLLCLVCVIGMLVSSFAQTSSLFVTTNKTTSLIFPFAIKHIDRGSNDIIVQQVSEADNILLVKASGKDFPETNLTVITGDGSVYNFSVDYQNSPAEFVKRLPSQSSASVATYANSILDNPKTSHGMADHNWDMIVRVSGIYIKENVIYYQLQFNNLSPIDYDIDFVRFYIRDKTKSKRTANQENELIPLYIAGNTASIKAASKSVIVVALQKFTIPDAKYLAIEINEKNGGRNLSMRVKNRKIMKAIPLPDLK